MTRNELLRHIINRTGWTPTQWNRYTGISRMTYYNIINKDIENIHRLTVEKLVKALLKYGFSDLVKMLTDESDTSDIIQIGKYLVIQNNQGKWERLNTATWKVEVHTSDGWVNKSDLVIIK